MSAARFRTGRFRIFFVGFFIIILLLGVMAMFHTCTFQCEQNIETLRKRVEIAMEQKYQMERVKEQESNEHLESKRNWEEKLKEQSEQHTKDLMEARVNLDKLRQTHKLLQNDHSKLVNESAKSKKQQLEDINSLEKKLHLLRSELEKSKNLQATEIEKYKEKNNILVNEKTNLENQLQLTSNKDEREKHIKLLEEIIKEYISHCTHKPKSLTMNLMQQQINNPLSPPETTHGSAKSGQLPIFDKPENKKSFSHQESMVPKELPRVSAEDQETQIKQQPENLAPVKEQKVLPLSAPRKLTSTQSTKSQQRVLEQAHNASVATSSSTLSPPLPIPNQHKQIPAMVAPIPELDQLLKEDASVPNESRVELQKVKTAVERDTANIDAAIEDTQQQKQQQKDNNNSGNDNNRYANVVNDMAAKASQKKLSKIFAVGDNNDSGAHEVKDHDMLVNEPNFNLPAEEDDNNDNFFDAGDKNAGDTGNAGNDKHKDEDDEDDDLGGDIAVKNQHLLEADNLNNEVAGDQGKEFPDGLRLEDANDEDEDEDEYANLAARHLGAQAIRN